MAANDLSLTFLVPGLLGPRFPQQPVPESVKSAVFEQLDVAPLELLLSRSRQERELAPERSLEGMLCRCFGIRGEPGRWPIAAITARGEDGAELPSQWMMRADPVHLRPDMRDTTLLEPAELRLSREEADELSRELNAHFEAEAWHLWAPAPERWYIVCEADQDLTTTELSLVSGSGIDGALPAGADAREWRRTLNEIQMLLHASTVNEQRTRRGLAAANSVWLWGGGRLPPPPARVWDRVYADEHLARALSEHVGAPWRPLPGEPRELLEEAPGAGRWLVVLGALYPIGRRYEVERWRSEVVSVCQRWFAAAWEGLRRGTFARVELAPGEGRRFVCTRFGARRWWRRKKALVHFVPN